jgi:pSer/pThr/pTyr-binding forkhead associated (FHA) protein
MIASTYVARMSLIECVGCGTELDPEAVDYCKECSIPVESSLQQQGQDSTDDQADEGKETEGTPAVAESSSESHQTPNDESDSEAAVEMTCPQCGSPYEPEENFCRSCGTELNTEDDSMSTDIGDSHSEPNTFEVSILVGDTAVPITDSGSVGAELRPLVADLTSREKALCISREQFDVAIDPEAEQCSIRDAGSKHGTVLNGEELPTNEYQEVTDGDTIELPPGFEMTVQIESGSQTESDPQPEAGSESPNRGSGVVRLDRNGKQEGYDVGDGESIGRGDEADVTIDGPDTVSRSHATVNQTSDGWALIDQSSNESFIRSTDSEDWVAVNDRAVFEDSDHLAFGTRNELVVFTVSID